MLSGALGTAADQRLDAVQDPVQAELEGLILAARAGLQPAPRPAPDSGPGAR